MNKLAGRILTVESSGDLSLVEVDVGGDTLTSLVLDTPETARYLAPGSPVATLFKETEVVLARTDLDVISLRNRLACVVRSREVGLLVNHFLLGYRDQVLHALITTRSAEALGLADEDQILALVKSIEVSLEREPG